MASWLISLDIISLSGSNKPNKEFFTNTGAPQSSEITYKSWQLRWRCIITFYGNCLDGIPFGVIKCPCQRIDNSLTTEILTEKVGRHQSRRLIDFEVLLPIHGNLHLW